MSDIWKGSMSFGLLNIPVGLKSAQQDKELHFSMLDKKDQAPIKYKRVNAETGQEVPYERIVKAYEFKDGQYITLSDADFKAANPKATQSIDIEDFVELQDIDPLLLEKPYYLVPEKEGEKGYVLLRDALEQTKKVAIAKVVLRSKQHLCAIFPRGKHLILEMLRFSHQVLEEREAPRIKANVKYTAKELHMAKELIDEMTSPWDPDKYEDTYYDDLMKLIQKKAKKGEAYEVEEPVKEEPTAEAPQEDLLALLRKSLNHHPPAHRRQASARGSGRFH